MRHHAFLHVIPAHAWHLPISSYHKSVKSPTQKCKRPFCDGYQMGVTIPKVGSKIESMHFNPTRKG